MPLRTIWERRAEVGLEAPSDQLRASAWQRFHLLTIGQAQHPYDPWPSFAKAHASPAQFILTSGGERVGKSIATAAEGFVWIPVSELIWIAGPHYSQAMKEFDYLLEACKRAAMKISDVRRSDRGTSGFLVRDTARGIDVRIQTKSLYDIEATVVADAPDLILVVEAGQVPRDPREKIRLRLSTRRGRCWLSGTLEEGSPWFLKAYADWQSWPNDESGFAINVPLYENTQDFAGGVDNAEILTLRRTLKPSTYSHRVEGKPAPSERLVFKDTFLHGHDPFWAHSDVKFVQLDENRDRIPVEIAIDPGHRPSYYTVHFLQRQGEDLCIIDEVAMLGSFHEQVIREAMMKPCWANVIGGTIDPWAATSHGLGWAQTPWDIWYNETGIKLRLAEPAPIPTQVIDRYRYYLKDPQTGKCHLWYDPVACPHYDYEVRHWQYEKDEEGRPMKQHPSKRHCDGLKGVGYFIWDQFSQHLVARHKGNWGLRPRVSPWRLR